MKKYFAIVLFVLVSMPSFAQVQRNKTKSPGDTSAIRHKGSNKADKKEMIKELDLTADQKVKFKELKRTHKDAKNAIENDATLSAAKKKEKLKTLRKDHFEKVKTILTPEQMEKFRQAKKDKHNDF